MAKLRIPLHLALALTLGSLTCDLGALCAMAGMDGCCCPVAAGTAPPCADVSGGDKPGNAKAPASLDSGERFAAAVLDSGAMVGPVAAAASSPGFGAVLDVATAATPLYLSHCAFLC